MSDPRKATDVLLSVEQKLDQLIRMLQNKDLSDKILSNKLNSLMSMLSEKLLPSVPTFTAEAVTSPPITSVKIDQDEALPIETQPSANGFSRTSRSETFAGDNSYLKKIPQKDNAPKMPIQVPKGDHVEIIAVPQQAVDINKAPPQQEQIPLPQARLSNTVSVVQRVTDKNGKSLFLADVEVIDKSTVTVVQKLKTNATGKWMCSLPIGDYSVVVKKRDPVTKQVVEVGQNLVIDGKSNPVELPLAIIKN